MAALSDLWTYSANRVPEISDSVVQIDQAMRNGFAWELDFTLPYPPAGHLRGSHYPSEQRRQRYLAQARAELRGSANGASTGDNVRPLP